MRKTSAAERVTVHSPSEIPSFSSEDDERDWWETHDLGEEFLPRYEALESLLASGLCAAEAPQVQVPLTLAKRSLRTMRRAARRRAYLYDRRIQDAVSAITFAADALEAGLNLYATSGNNEAVDGHRKSQALRQNPTRKTLSAISNAEGDKPPQQLSKVLLDLLDRRNVLVHGIPPTDDDISHHSPGDWDVQNAPLLVDAAESFLRQLWLSPRGRVKRGFHPETTSRI